MAYAAGAHLRACLPRRSLIGWPPLWPLPSPRAPPSSLPFGALLYTSPLVPPQVRHFCRLRKGKEIVRARVFALSSRIQPRPQTMGHGRDDLVLNALEPATSRSPAAAPRLAAAPSSSSAAASSSSSSPRRSSSSASTARRTRPRRAVSMSAPAPVGAAGRRAPSICFFRATPRPSVRGSPPGPEGCSSSFADRVGLGSLNRPARGHVRVVPGGGRPPSFPLPPPSGRARAL